MHSKCTDIMAFIHKLYPCIKMHKTPCIKMHKTHSVHKNAQNFVYKNAQDSVYKNAQDSVYKDEKDSVYKNAQDSVHKNAHTVTAVCILVDCASCVFLCIFASVQNMHRKYTELRVKMHTVCTEVW